MHLIQILLPLTDNNGHALDRSLYSEIKEELTDRFGGITAYSRAPAEGRWHNEHRDIKDEIIIYEVMAGTVDLGWWARYRSQLQHHFKQQEIIIRALPMEIL